MSNSNPRQATLTKRLVFKTQQGLSGPVLEPGTRIVVRYNDNLGCYDARTSYDGKPVIRKDIPLHTFEWGWND